MADQLNQTELAEWLLLSTRQVRNLEAEGMPVKSDDGKKFYVWSDVFAWYLERKQQEAIERAGGKAGSGMQGAELRKAVAEAELAELRLQKLRREVVPIAEYRGELGRILGAVRARIVGMPGEWAARCVALVDMATATRRLREISAAQLAALQQAAAAAPDAVPPPPTDKQEPSGAVLRRRGADGRNRAG